MANTKVYDVVVKVGEYQDSNGETKGRYENVGSVMKNDEGRSYVILKRTFNPAGVPNPNDRDSVILSLFKPDQNGNGGNAAPAASSAKKSAPAADLDEEIPF